MSIDDSIKSLLTSYSSSSDSPTGKILTMLREIKEELKEIKNNTRK